LILNPLHNCDLHKFLFYQVLTIHYFSLKLVLFGSMPKQLSKDTFVITVCVVAFFSILCYNLQVQNGTQLILSDAEAMFLSNYFLHLKHFNEKSNYIRIST